MNKSRIKLRIILLTLAICALTTLATINLYTLPVHAVTTDELMPPASNIKHSPSTEYEEIKALKKLPNVTIEQTASTIVKTVLEIAMALAVIALVVAGVYYLMFEGEDEKMKKAKSTILYLIIGMAIISAAYAIIGGLIQFKFF